MNEYLASYETLEAIITRYDNRIEKISKETRYKDRAEKHGYFLCIKTHSAISLIVETGDFKRFAKENTYAFFLELVPSEHSSSTDIKRLGISKAGNFHLRVLLIGAAKGSCKRAIGHKTKAMRSKQYGQPSEVISYADNANTRLSSKYYRIIRHGKNNIVAVAAVSRELACFVWGMTTGNIVITPRYSFISTGCQSRIKNC